MIQRISHLSIKLAIPLKVMERSYKERQSRLFSLSTTAKPLSPAPQEMSQEGRRFYLYSSRNKEHMSRWPKCGFYQFPSICSVKPCGL